MRETGYDEEGDKKTEDGGENGEEGWKERREGGNNKDGRSKRRKGGGRRGMVGDVEKDEIGREDPDPLLILIF